MKLKANKIYPSDSIVFSPAEKGVLKRMRSNTTRDLACMSMKRAEDNCTACLFPTEAEIDAEFAKKLVIWLTKRIAKQNL